MSDALSFILQYIIRYRKGTVEKNIRLSFPEKSDEEINSITRLFYKNLSDVALESIKGYSVNEDKLLKRYKCVNPNLAGRYFLEGRSVIFALSHYANWEWGTQVAGTVFLHDTISFYKPLSNRYIDDYLCQQRAMRGMKLCSIYQTKFIFRTKHIMPKAFFLVSDQNPSNVKRAYWVNFLNQDTACIRGVESYARMFDLPVIYADVQRVSRGHYTVVLEELCDNPKITLSGEITKLYMKKLEEIIIRKPEDWLWSHKRWKAKKPVENLIDNRRTISFKTNLEGV